jgi:hypothetical protein
MDQEVIFNGDGSVTLLPSGTIIQFEEIVEEVNQTPLELNGVVKQTSVVFAFLNLDSDDADDIEMTFE